MDSGISFIRWGFYADLAVPFTNVVLIFDLGIGRRVDGERFWLHDHGWRRRR